MTGAGNGAQPRRYGPFIAVLGIAAVLVSLFLLFHVSKADWGRKEVARKEHTNLCAEEPPEQDAAVGRRGGGLIFLAVDSNGEPVGGGNLWLAREDPSPDSANCDQAEFYVFDNDGVVLLEDLDVGKYRWTAEAPDFLKETGVADVCVGTTRHVTVKLSADGILEGRVILSNGAPFPFVFLEARPADRAQQAATLLPDIMADANGAFTIRATSDREFLIVVKTMTEHLFGAETVFGPFRSPQRDLRLVVSPGIAIYGSVRDATSGLPVGRATIVVMERRTLASVSGSSNEEDGSYFVSHLEEWLQSNDCESSTGEDRGEEGKARFEVIDLKVSADTNGYLREEKSVRRELDLENPEIIKVDFSLRRSARVRLGIVDQEGSRLNHLGDSSTRSRYGKVLKPWSKVEFLLEWKELKSDGSERGGFGTVEVFDVPPRSTCSARALIGNYESDVETFIAAGPGELLEVLLQLRGGLSVSGSVIGDSHVDLSGLTVSLVGAQGEEVVESRGVESGVAESPWGGMMCFTDENGVFRFGGIPPGRYRLSLAPGPWMESKLEVRQQAGIPIEVVGTSLHGVTFEVCRDSARLPARND